MSIDWRQVTVVVGRPEATAGRWLNAFSDLGARAVHQPGLEIVASPSDEPTLADAAQITPTDAAVFSSPAAVAHGLRLKPLRRWLEAGGLCWAVGEQTGKRLLAAGALKIRTPGTGSGVDALLMESDFPDAGRVFLIAARGGRQRLAEVLEDRHIECRWIYAYARRPAPLNLAAERALREAPGPVVVLGTSLAIVERLSTLLGSALGGSVLVSVSERITRAAADLQFQRIVTVPEPSLASVLEGVKVALAGAPHGKSGG
ncbi:MAG: uroporphyrinogen-III synthase [Pseudomonadota bacterium]